MMSLTVGLDKNLSTYIRQLKDGLGPLLDKAAMETASHGKSLIIRSTAKGATGLTQGGWDVKKERSAVYKIWNRFKHALFLETGTGLFGPKHQRIFPKVAKVLAWTGWNKNTSTGMNFATSTAGMPAQPAIAPNVDKIQKDLNIRVRNGIRRMFKAVKAEKA